MGVHLLLVSVTFSNYAYLLTVLLSLKLLPVLVSETSINLAAREYLNKHGATTGLALAINEVLYSRNILSQMLGIATPATPATPAKPTRPITSISV